jgi:hypothetical protein
LAQSSPRAPVALSDLGSLVRGLLQHNRRKADDGGMLDLE